MAAPNHEKVLDGAIRIVFFDLETSGLEEDCDVLEVAMKSGDAKFSAYINPSKPIPASTTSINNLTYLGGKLYLDGKLQQSQPAETVLKNALTFLEGFGTLVAHNCEFDAKRLTRAIKICKLESEFKAVVRHFSDTVRLFREKFPQRNQRGSLKLTTLVKDFLKLPIGEAHSAEWDASMLEMLSAQEFSHQEILEKTQSVDFYLRITKGL